MITLELNIKATGESPAQVRRAVRNLLAQTMRAMSEQNFVTGADHQAAAPGNAAAAHYQVTAPAPTLPAAPPQITWRGDLHYRFKPRYTQPGGDSRSSILPENVVRHLARGEQEAYAGALRGERGAAAQQQAQQLGLAGIAMKVTEATAGGQKGFAVEDMLVQSGERFVTHLD